MEGVQEEERDVWDTEARLEVGWMWECQLQWRH
jgi:hypothetical protein